jgi:hypothetical protein
MTLKCMRMLEGLAVAAERDLGAATAKYARAVGDVAKLIEDERDVDPRWSTFGASIAILTVSVAVAQAEVAAHAGRMISELKWPQPR